jgi:hypothetical protein
VSIPRDAAVQGRAADSYQGVPGVPCVLSATLAGPPALTQDRESIVENVASPVARLPALVRAPPWLSRAGVITPRYKGQLADEIPLYGFLMSCCYICLQVDLCLQPVPRTVFQYDGYGS